VKSPQKTNKIKKHDVPDLHRSLHRICFYLELQFRQHGFPTSVKKVNTSFKNVCRTWGPALPTLLADLMIFCPLGPTGPTNFKNSAILAQHETTFLNDVFTFLTEVGNAGCIVNTGTSSVNSEFVTALNT
jgi:hypothetical protein